MSPLTQKNRLLAVDTPLGADVLLLASFTGQEQMSRLFRYSLQTFSTENEIAPSKIVGKRITFTVKRADGSLRYFNGFVCRFSASSHESGYRSFQVEVVPWLWFLTQTSDCRIFQNKTVPEIVEQVFQDLGFSDFDKSEIKGSHPKREYCVQYRETDFDFVSRLLEEEGIFYFFRHENGKHMLLLADQKGAYKDLPEKEVQYEYSRGSAVVEDRLTTWEHRYEFISGKCAQTDYNFADHPARSEATPANLLMTKNGTSVSLPGVEKFELYDFPGEYQEKADGQNLTRLRMEEVETAYDTVYASGTCKTFSPGGKFTIKRHDAKAEEGKAYAVTSIQHSAREATEYTGGEQVGEVYSNSFTCIPDSVVFRPQRITPRPMIHGVQTAVVTGPPGEEIYPDKHGRVKVQFFWDREGKRDDKTSCWIRVSQNYAGKRWGEVTIPRIGQEVIVSFLEGDPDRPIITGRVYNADQVPPYPLPAQKMVSGLKSNTTPGGGGYNEFIMDDTKGNELIREHGQFDKDSTIEHDLREHVHHDRTRDVTNDETISVGKNRTESVGDNESLMVGKNQSISVGQSRSKSVGGGETISVGKDRTESVGKNQSLSVQENRAESIGKNDSLTVGQALSITAGDSITLTTGAASITMRKDGTISIKGKDILITGSGKITAKADSDMVLKGSKISAN